MGRKAASLTLAAASSWILPIGSPQAHADAPDLVVQHDARLRWEHVQTDGFQDEAEALTLRLRSSLETSPFSTLTVLAETEAIAALLPDDRNGAFAPSRPAISDTETLELNRLQVEFTPSDAVSLTLGRQRIAQSDERFIGTVNFRQNQQTYDALSARYTASNGATLKAGYIWQVNRVLGNRRADGTFDSDSSFLLASAPTPAGQVSAFRYDLDLDAGAGTVQRSETVGIALDGRTFTDDLGVFWTAGLARQEGAGGEPSYGRAGVSLEWPDVTVGLRYERLGSDSGVAFQTPLATLHKFQGATDTFIVTPPDGIEDVQFSGTWRFGSAGPLRGSRLSVQFNNFTSAQGNQAYGHELGLNASAVLHGVRWTLAWSGYRENGFGADTDKFWLTVSQRF